MFVDLIVFGDACVEMEGNNFGGSTSSGIGLHAHHNSSASDYGSIGGSSGHATPQHIASNQQSNSNLSFGQHAGPDGTTGMYIITRAKNSNGPGYFIQRPYTIRIIKLFTVPEQFSPELDDILYFCHGIVALFTVYIFSFASNKIGL